MRAIAILGLFVLGCGPAHSQTAPDIRTVAADLVVPELSDGQPAPGKRVKVTIREGVYYVLYLPENYRPENRHPLIVEFAGNGGYKNKYGDESHGVPEGSNLGYGISGGKDFAWLCVPFLNERGDEIATWWWGDKPTFSPDTTVALTKRLVPEIVEKYSLDAKAVLLTGFSRGAIACNYIGLRDDEIAELWCGMIPYSHYDGSRDWGFEDSDPKSARERLKRLHDRPQLICHENDGKGLLAAKESIAGSEQEGNLTFLATGFRNHNDAWILRPSAARDELYRWLEEVPGIRTALSRIRTESKP